MTWIFQIAGGLLALYIVLCLFYFTFQERWIFVPLGKLSKNAHIRLGSPYEEVWIEGEEKGDLHALYLPVENALGTILYFHGNTGNIKRWGAVAEEVSSLGYNVLVPDYRGYGKSRGKRSEQLLKSDAVRWYEFLVEYQEFSAPVIYGRSLGSAMACHVAANKQVSGLVLESPFYSLEELAGHYIPFVPARWLVRYTFRNHQCLKNARCPIAIFHGTKDIIVPYSSGHKLFQIVRERSEVEMITIPGGKHNDLNGYPIFREKLRDFLKSAVNRGS